MEEKIAKYMKNLGISREEAIALLEDDKEVDRGHVKRDLPPELEAGAKKARRAERKKTDTKRTVKPKPEKSEICQVMMESLQEAFDIDDFEVINPEREFCFLRDGVKYRVVLQVPRK